MGRVAGLFGWAATGQKRPFKTDIGKPMSSIRNGLFSVEAAFRAFREGLMSKEAKNAWRKSLQTCPYLCS